MAELGSGFLVSLIGFATVFSVLVLLILAVRAMSTILERLPRKEAKSPPTPIAETLPGVHAASFYPTMTPEEFAAVSGALAVALNRDMGQFVVRSVRRIGEEAMSDEAVAAVSGVLAQSMNLPSGGFDIRPVR